jgi:hypothetical protein
VLAVTGVPLENAKFAVVFPGPAVDGILNSGDEEKRCRILRLRAIPGWRKDRSKNLDPDVTPAVDALLVLMQYQNRGYDLPSF